MLRGLDCSRYQGTINWDAVKASGVQFAVIKVGGSDDGLYSDSQWLRNNDEVNRIGMPRWFYYFLGGGNPRVEAEHFVGILGNLFVGEGVVLDYEVNRADEENYLADCATRVKELIGFPPVIYMSASRIHAKSWQRVRDLGCGLWVAQWGSEPTSAPWPFWAMWQTSSTGSIPGINGNVDTDLFASDSVEVFKKYGKPALPPPPPVTPPPTTPAPTTKSTTSSTTSSTTTTTTSSSTSSSSSSSSSTTTKQQPLPLDTIIQKIINFFSWLWKFITNR